MEIKRLFKDDRNIILYMVKMTWSKGEHFAHMGDEGEDCWSCVLDQERGDQLSLQGGSLGLRRAGSER